MELERPVLVVSSNSSTVSGAEASPIPRSWSVCGTGDRDQPRMLRWGDLDESMRAGRIRAKENGAKKQRPKKERENH